MSNQIKNRDGGRAIAGLLLVGVGAALLLRNMDFPFFPYWLFTWPMILVLVGIYTGVKHNFRNNSWIILIGLGAFFLVDDIFPGISVRPFFWPIIIILIGIVFILRPRSSSRWRDYRRDYRRDYDTQFRSGDYYTSSGFTTEKTRDAGDLLHISSIFSGVNRTVLSKNFQGGNISCVFGGAEVDFTQADINGRVILRIEQVFGGVKLIVPSHWVVQNELDGVFHGVEDKRGYKSPSTIANPDKVLILKGSSVFGGVEIKSY